MWDLISFDSLQVTGSERLPRRLRSKEEPNLKYSHPSPAMFPIGPGGKMAGTKAWVFFFLVLEVTSVSGMG